MFLLKKKKKEEQEQSSKIYSISNDYAISEQKITIIVH